MKACTSLAGIVCRAICGICVCVAWDVEAAVNVEGWAGDGAMVCVTVGKYVSNIGVCNSVCGVKVRRSVSIRAYICAGVCIVVIYSSGTSVGVGVCGIGC